MPLRSRRQFRSRAVAAVMAVSAAFATRALAQAPNLGLQFATATGLATTDIRTIVGRIISYFLGLLGIIAVGIILYAGFLWMTSGGDEQKIGKAKKWLTNAVIGLVIIMSAYAIARFIIGAVSPSSQGPTGAGGCPAGQTCSSGFGPGGAGSFRVNGIVPWGSGPNNGGWPKNYALTVSFNAAPNAASVTAKTVEVDKCNARLDGSGNPAPFNPASCGAVVTGTLTVDASKVLFRPSATPGANPTDFEADFWYKIRLQGGAITDAIGRTLLCPFETADISTSAAGPDYCDRAAAFNAIRDVTAPTVSIDSPASPPAFCGALPARIRATAQDDFLVAGVNFLLNGGTSSLIDVNGNPSSYSANGALANPFIADSVYVDIASLQPGTQKLTAVAQDGVPLSSAPAEKDFTVSAPHCCNLKQDSALGETGIDCGANSGCGACSGASCTTGANCSSGYCDPTTHQCAAHPVIDDVAPLAGGPGTLVTIIGRGFGSTPGTVTFLGTSDPADNKTAQACAPQAWSDTQVVVAVPVGAVNGAIELTTSTGQSDATDDTFGAQIPDFTVNTVTLPGICYLSPSSGAPGSQFVIHGAGFGASIGTSAAFVGSFTASIANGGWTPTAITAIVPTAPENTYPVTVNVGGQGSNSSNFLVQSTAASSAPRVISLIPDSGPVGSYVTIQGTGFGTRKGTVKFYYDSGTTHEVALGEDPVCNDNWHDNYVVVKVPQGYQPDPTNPVNAVVTSSAGVLHRVEVQTAAPSQTSNSDVTFAITNAPPRPGICAIEPDNGPPGISISVTGEGFGTGPGSGTAFPRNSVEFYKTNALHCLTHPSVSCTVAGASCANPADGTCVPTTVTANGYSTWSPTNVGAIVGGDRTNKSTWPATGPAYVIATNQLSTNAIPFKVQDCNESGAACAAGTICCANGACQTSCVPPARVSAYGWLFSTDVLPSLPVVVERASCDATASVPVLQSPSPFRDTADACVNASFYVEFSKPLDVSTFDPSTVQVQDCGNQATPNCASPVSVTFVSFNGCTSSPSGPQQCSTATFIPDSTYNGGVLKPSTWYRTTLVADPVKNVGLREASATGKYLDGDFDRKEGGNYVWTFRTRASSEPCQLSSVIVNKSTAIIDQNQSPVNFDAEPLGLNCNILRCDGNPQPYSVTWLANSTYLNITKYPATNNGCTKPVLAVRETLATPTTLVARVKPIGTTLTKNGTSQITVKFAEPHVISVEPVDGCTQACINAAIGAQFNIPMDPATLTQPGNVEMFRCRNASCLAPFEADLGGATRTVSVTPADAMAADGTPLYLHVSLQGAGNLLPNTYYLVRIKGGAGAVTSLSGTPLGGLNDGTYYTWKFQTKNDPTACKISRAALVPESATLYYVGERQPFVVKAYGSPDACSKGGEELAATSYSWNWDFDAPTPNPVLGGFVDGSQATPISASPIGTAVDTNPVSKTGCDNRCLHVGSQNTVPQCGDGIVETKFEECDPKASNAIAGTCTANCLWTGTAAPKCGNGAIDPGEECDAVHDPANGGKLTFPPGCRQPTATANGCLFGGSSSVKGAVCGDGVIEDGEACDDGNRANGDGCNANCLKEGSLPTCIIVANPLPGQNCINFCGNAVVEPGEDSSCEGPAGPAAYGCDPTTCLKIGEPACTSSGQQNCCGNGVVDKGEDGICENGGLAQGYCTDHCVLKGSSSFYAHPSFCGDGIAGWGERQDCEQGVSPDGLIDSVQVTQSAIQSGFNATSSSGNVSTVKAVTGGVKDQDAGRAHVTLSCTCKTKPAGAQDSFCASFDQAGIDLACADNGCCENRPTVLQSYPAGNNVCRNTEISVTWSAKMDSASVTQNVLVGVQSAGGCPAGSTSFIAAGPSPSADVPHTVIGRIWQAVRSWLDAIVSPVFGAQNTYCSVQGTVTTTDVGDVSVTRVTVKDALPASAAIRVEFLPGAKSADGVHIASNGYGFDFTTGTIICAIDRIAVLPPSIMLQSVNDTNSFAAQALTKGDAQIVPTAEYPWTWSWLSHADGEAAVDPIVLEPVLATTGAQTEAANVRVRGSKSTDTYKPGNGDSIVYANATLGAPNAGTFIGIARATVLLCNNPWPQTQVCPDSGSMTLPWDTATTYACTPTQRSWFPFYDKDTRLQFSYCRDGATAGDATAVLPALDETPVVIHPGRDIFKEYLFTYDASVAPGSGVWTKDAIGLRISANTAHLGIADWYAEKGFRGSPTGGAVDGFDALKEGRTVYVNAAASPAFQPATLYTNANTLSYNDNAAPETVAVFSQLLQRFGFMYAVKNVAPVDDVHACFDANGVLQPASDTPFVPATCTRDVDCRVDPQGAPVAGHAGYVCGDFKTKLVRDVRRLADLQHLRAALIAKKSSNGGYPKLSSGTFIAGQTNSAWSSWNDTLSSAIGAELPSDPLNLHGICPSPYDPKTCWNAAARLYQCPVDSHVYQYYSVGDLDFALSNDLEFHPSGVHWQGTTCIDYTTQSSCTAGNAAGFDPNNCAWNAASSSCNYVDGKLTIGGVNVVPRTCTGQTVGTGGRCGDGALGPQETCELGQTRSASCSANGRTGAILQECNQTCNGWVNAPGAVCEGGKCGDGVVQSPEACDDGSLNGTYGHCNSTCTATSARCGDGTIQPPEKCDISAGNGQYAKNGVLATSGQAWISATIANAPSCAWDCSGAGPRCGDGVVNGNEQCDGGSQTSKGYCNDTANSPCNSNADCPTSKTCKVAPAPQQYVRQCNSNNPATTTDDAAACTWASWQLSGAVAAVPARCGDGHVDAGEECDLGASNGTACVPAYGKDCSYCTATCKVAAVSGGFCGDKIVQDGAYSPPGPEQCDINGPTFSSDKWICVGNNPYDIWTYDRYAALNQSGGPSCWFCYLACPNSNMHPCLNDPTHDSDGDGIGDTCDPTPTQLPPSPPPPPAPSPGSCTQQSDCASFGTANNCSPYCDTTQNKCFCF